MKYLLVFFIIVFIPFSGVAKDNLNKIERNEMKGKVPSKNSYTFVKHPKISRNNLSIEIVDGRKDKFQIGNVSPKNIKLIDWYGDVYDNARKIIKKILEDKGFKDNVDADTRLLIRIAKLSDDVKVGIISKHITQACIVAVSVIQDDDTVFSRDFSCSYTYTKRGFKDCYEPLFKEYYCNTQNKDGFQHWEWNQIVKDKIQKHFNKNVIDSQVVDFLVVINNVVNQLFKDNTFQNLFSK